MRQIVVILMILPTIFCASLHFNDITPEDAQKYFAEQTLDLNYGKRLDRKSLAQIRTETGRDFYYNGRKIEKPEDFVEETYEAEQFHGQDGLGRAMFGYTDHNQARLEARNVNGDVRGSYQFIDPEGENVVVQYWSDALGFHQTDNRPKIIVEPITETPEVQAARIEHERAWEEAARLAKENPDPMSDVYNRRAIEYDNRQLELLSSAASERVSNQAQSLTRYPHLEYSEHIKPQNPTSLTDDDSVVIESIAAESQTSERKQKFSGKDDKEIEIPSVPRGFFYKFQYPVHLIAELEEKRALKKQQEISQKVRRHSSPSRTAKAATTISDEKKTDEVNSNDDKVKLTRVSLKAAEAGAIPIDAVHDVQVHPKQKSDLVDSQKSPVHIHSD